MSAGVGTQGGDGQLPRTTENDSGPGAVDGPSRDQLYNVLGNRRRRFVIHYLKGHDEPVEIGDLAERVAAWENDCGMGEVTSTQRKRTYTALQQSHLPVMNDARIVEFDKDRGVVGPTEQLEEIDIYLDFVEGNDIPWSEYYLGLSAVGAATIAAIWLGVWPLTGISPFQWLVFMVVALAISAVVHVRQTRSNRVGGDGPPPELR